MDLEVPRYAVEKSTISFEIQRFTSEGVFKTNMMILNIFWTIPELFRLDFQSNLYDFQSKLFKFNEIL